MALTKPAGWAIQILSIPVIAIGFVMTLSVALTWGMGTATLRGNLPMALVSVATLLIGVLMLKSGKRATAPPAPPKT